LHAIKGRSALSLKFGTRYAASRLSGHAGANDVPFGGALRAGTGSARIARAQNRYRALRQGGDQRNNARRAIFIQRVANALCLSGPTAGGTMRENLALQAKTDDSALFAQVHCYSM